jgi:hypothetical protein
MRWTRKEEKRQRTEGQRRHPDHLESLLVESLHKALQLKI